MAKKGELMKTQTFKAGILSNTSFGFSLFELLIVLLIIGTIAGVAIPKINTSSPEQAIRTVERNIAGTVSEARSRALLRQQPLELHFGKHEITLQQRGNIQELKNVVLPQQVTISHVTVDQISQRTLLFSAKGITQTASIEISSPPYIQVISINPIHGISLQK